MREVANRILVGSGVAAADKTAYDLQKNIIAPNTYVFFNPVTGKTVGPGVTYADVPRLGIAQAVDLDKDGMSDALRKAFGNEVSGDHLWNVTTDIPVLGMNKIEDFYFKCTNKDTDYSINVEWRNDNTLNTNLHNQWSYTTLSVRVSDYACSSCESGVDEMEVACALANQFYAKGILDDKVNNSTFLRRSIQTQSKNADVDVMPIFQKEVQYCIASYAGTCGDCGQIDSIGGMTIVANGGTILTDIVIPFGSTTVPGDDTKSYYAQKDRIIALINAGLKANNVGGYAVAIEGLSGTGKPCAGFNILINSCESITLQDGSDVDITPCQAEYNPYTALTFTNQSECLGCGTGSTFTPNAGFRAIGKGIKVNSSCVEKLDRKSWYHTDVRITLNERSNFKQYEFKTMQEVVVPKNLGVQFAKMMFDQNVTGSGFDYQPSNIDHRGLYQENRSARLQFNDIGLDNKDIYASISMKHGLSWNTTHTNQPDTIAKGTTILLIAESDTATKAAVKAILDPWLASLPNPKGALSLTTDDDQTNTIVTDAGVITQEAVDDKGE